MWKIWEPLPYCIFLVIREIINIIFLISGYFLLSVFSLFTCTGLLILLFMHPRPGTPLADMTTGAIAGISGLSLFLAAIGVFSSYCCCAPPPDNRVQHGAPSFTV